MRPQMLDESIRFSCQGCTRCCDQPWRTMIEADKAHALDRHDFSSYPQLAGKTFYRDAGDERYQNCYELAKGDGARCLFLDTDGRCIIHKELGPEAKPQMCRKFPYVSTRTSAADRVSVNYGCPAVQNGHGPPLSEQAAEVAEVITPTPQPPDPHALVPLGENCELTQPENDALMDRVVRLFEHDREGDVWTRFAELLTLLVAAARYKLAPPPDDPTTGALAELLRSDQPLPDTPEVPPIRAYSHPGQTPMRVRFLFAATLFPDTVATSDMKSKGLLKQIALFGKLLTLAKMSGTYSSRALGRNVSIHEAVQHEVADELETAATQQLLRYYRSRLWQRYLAGTRLPVIAGIHQHILDLNAIMFLARSEAHRLGSERLTEPLIRQALSLLELHLASQVRLYDVTLKGWLRAQLQDPTLALESLRLMALKPAEQAADTPADQGPSAP